MRLLWLEYGELRPADAGGKLRSCNMRRALRAGAEGLFA
jgi:hypothetical protein